MIYRINSPCSYVDDSVVTKYEELKLGHSHRYAFFRMNDTQTSIVVDKTAPPSATFDQFVKDLPPNDCRYAVFDFEYELDGGRRNKILFVLWAPDTAKIKAKMLYTSSKDAIRKKLVGLGVEIQATDYSEIDRQVVLDKVNKV